MKVYILAVTSAYKDYYCIAGMDEGGNWVRPISSIQNTRFWKKCELTFNKGFDFIRAGDVIEFRGDAPPQYQHPNHVEDIVVQENQLTLVDRLNNLQLINFLENKDETEQAFNKTVNAKGRSLCLIKVDSFQHAITQFEDNPPKPKMTFTNSKFNVDNPQTYNGDYIVKDLVWSDAVLKDLVDKKQAYTDIYLTIGLATPSPYNRIEYPQVIGLHTSPVIIPTNKVV
ncbi:dual OB domain-containing protein [Bacillus altitudinis]|uniref:dual OB domain-containing protein n=1 Tax=Bacillus altitudinis TaxID=293387 RepID=UPI0037CCBBBB